MFAGCLNSKVKSLKIPKTFITARYLNPNSIYVNMKSLLAFLCERCIVFYPDVDTNCLKKVEGSDNRFYCTEHKCFNNLLDSHIKDMYHKYDNINFETLDIMFVDYFLHVKNQICDELEILIAIYVSNGKTNVFHKKCADVLSEVLKVQLPMKNRLEKIKNNLIKNQQNVVDNTAENELLNMLAFPPPAKRIKLEEKKNI